VEGEDGADFQSEEGGWGGERGEEAKWLWIRSNTSSLASPPLIGYPHPFLSLFSRSTPESHEG
jgi:hypothetical protein